MAGALEDRERTVRKLRQSRAGCPGAYDVVALWITRIGVDPREERAHARLVQEPRCQLSRDQRSRVRLETLQPTVSSRCFVECGSVKHCEKKNSRKSS